MAMSDKINGKIDAFVRGELDANEAAEVARYIAAHPELEREVAIARRIAAGMKGLHVDASNALADRVLAARPRPRRWFAGAGLLAASLVLGSALFFTERGQEEIASPPVLAPTLPVEEPEEVKPEEADQPAADLDAPAPSLRQREAVRPPEVEPKHAESSQDERRREAAVPASPAAAPPAGPSISAPLMRSPAADKSEARAFSGATNGNASATGEDGFALNEVNIDMSSQMSNDISSFDKAEFISDTCPPDTGTDTK